MFTFVDILPARDWVTSMQVCERDASVVGQITSTSGLWSCRRLV